jgi:hypothetical protein
MPQPWNEREVLAVCRRFRDAAPSEAILPEPYLPYIPTDWNGILVLAEAQHLAGDTKYRRWLTDQSSEDRMRRLPNAPDSVGVGPWDNGRLPLALKAAFPDIQVDQVGVSNAVPWSCCKPNDTNKNPTKAMRQAAVEFWKALLPAWQPEMKRVITVGKIARQVMEAVGPDAPLLVLRSASPRYVNQVMRLFWQDDLLGRYGEVAEAADALGKKPDEGDIFFACHAVSRAAKGKKEN